MRVLLICGSYPPVKCGVGDYTALLAAELAATPGNTVGVLTGRDAAGSGAAQGVELLPHLDSWGVNQLPKISAIVLAWQPDIVHIQYPSKGYGKGKGALFLPYLLGRSGYKVVQTWHEPLGALRRLRYLPAALTSDALVVVEPDYAAFIPCWFRKILRRKRFFSYIPVGSNIPSRLLTESERLRWKNEFDAVDRNLVAYFGFVAPPKGVEALFSIADPAKDRLLLVCDLDENDPYQKSILALIDSEAWRGRAFVTGYRAAAEVACLLAAADIAVFPFLDGATSRNASVLAARAQGTCVLTTSGQKRGYYESDNIYFAPPGDLDDLRSALRRYCGRRGRTGATADWAAIAVAHLELYREMMKGNSQGD
jgi:glycosyltransferase involved in cell wall biosynthesis